MISWLKQPIEHMAAWAVRKRFYVVAIILVAASVPFLHLYMDDQLSLAEMIVHTLSIVLSTVVAILLFELMLWVYLKSEVTKWGMSIGLFWLILFGLFSLSFIVMGVTHDFLPITLEIWNKHILRDLGTMPWKMLPVVLLIGYILIQLIRRYQFSQELAALKKLNLQLQAVNSGAESLENKAKENQHSDTPKFVFSHKGKNICLDPVLIVRVESNENYCHVFTAPNEEQSEYGYMVRITLTDVIKQLPEHLFLQVHRSHIVNFTYVSALERQGRNYQLQLTNGASVPVSRSRIKQIREKVDRPLRLQLSV